MIDIDITKRPDESELEFHKRIIYGKLVDKTLSDVDYTELSELVYGQAYSSDVARRMFYGSRRTLELMDSITDGNIRKDTNVEIDPQVLALQKERQKVQDQRREYKKILASDARLEHLCEILAASADKLSATVGTVFEPCHVPSLYTDDSMNEAVLVFSDWHYGMTADNIFNKYDTDICKKRVQSVVDEAKKRLRLHQCRKLHLFVLGDLIHGAIHTSARVASEELVCDQLMQVSEIFAQSVINLSLYVDEVKVYTTYGNHARTVQNKNDSIHRDNLERIIPWWLEQRIAAEELRIGGNLGIEIITDIGNEFIAANICGHEICATHGDLDSVKNSPRMLALLFQKKYKRNVEYVIIGDKHHRESFEELGVCATICGSLCGTDDYANEKRLFSLPSQMMLIVNEESGVDAEYHLKCCEG